MLVYLRDGSAQTIVRPAKLRQKLQIKLECKKNAVMCTTLTKRVFCDISGYRYFTSVDLLTYGGKLERCFLGQLLSGIF